MRKVKANYKQTRNGYRAPNILGGRRYNRTCFAMPSRKHKGQIQLKNWKEIEIFKRNKKARLTII